MVRPGTVFFVVGVLAALGVNVGWSQDIASKPTPECAPYYDAVTGGPTPEVAVSAPAVPESLLREWQTAIPCLSFAIAGLRSEVEEVSRRSEVEKKPLEFPPSLRAKFLRAAGAVRAIMGANKSDDELRKVITAFREVDNLDVASVLSFGARTTDYNVRLNAMLVFSNVVDNTTVCAPIDHLYDKRLEGDDDAAAKGRVNLLAVVNVVAPWAYRENYLNIENVQKYWSAKAAENQKYRGLVTYLENIKSRLESQPASSNKAVSLTPQLGACRQYVKKWAPAEQFKY